MLSRVIITVGGAAFLLLASALPALADPWGSVDCSQSPTPACELGAGKGGANHYGGKPDRRPRHGEQGDHRREDNGGDHIVGGDKPVRCSYVRSDYQPPTTGVATIAYQPRSGNRTITVQPAVLWRALVVPAVLPAVVAEPAPDQPGAWYVYKCDRAGVVDALYRAPVWIPDGQPSRAPSAAELAQQARKQLTLPSPRIQANPAGTQLVNLPTWLWLDRTRWGQRSAMAEVPGVSVTAVARPTRVSWSMGDGVSVTCHGQGTPFPAGGDPKAASPDCSHVYRISSAGRPDQAFPVIATVHWTIIWSGAGQSGTFPDLTTSASTQFQVAEAQALGTGTG